MSIEDAVNHRFYDPMEHGINIINPQEKLRKLGMDNFYQLQTVISEARNLIEHPQGNPYQQLVRYRKLVPKLLRQLESDLEDYNLLNRQLERFGETSYDNSNKRWNKEDDEQLIESICDGKMSLYQISTMFGRSPSAITTRVSYLVGINRISTEIAGRFIGAIDGKDIDGEIKGTLYKEKK